MSISVLYEVPDTPEKLQTWSFTHAILHRDIIRVIFQVYGTVLTEHQLDPLDPSDMAQWLYRHQIMHEQQDRVLGIQTSDLMSVDWRERDSLISWLQQHGNEHQQASTILGV